MNQGMNDQLSPGMRDERQGPAGAMPGGSHQQLGDENSQKPSAQPKTRLWTRPLMTVPRPLLSPGHRPPAFGGHVETPETRGPGPARPTHPAGLSASPPLPSAGRAGSLHSGWRRGDGGD